MGITHFDGNRIIVGVQKNTNGSNEQLILGWQREFDIRLVVTKYLEFQINETILVDIQFLQMIRILKRERESLNLMTNSIRIKIRLSDFTHVSFFRLVALSWNIDLKI